jgi:AraC-like DNA-binding protein
MSEKGNGGLGTCAASSGSPAMSDPTCIASPADAGYLVVRFSSADYAPRERLKAWREIYGRTLQKLDIEPLSVEQFHCRATLRRMPGLAMLAGRRSAAIYRRPREFIDHDDVGLTMGLTSDYQAHQFGRTLNMRRGEAIVLTGSAPAFLRVPTYGKYINLRVPLRALAPLVAGIDAAYGRAIPADNSALRLLSRYIGILEGSESLSAADLRRQAISHIHDLMALAIGATRDAAEIANCRGVRAARLKVIKEDIANQLDQADLSVAVIAARHRVQPRYVQRLFESEGTTFTEYVLAQRLARARRRLRDPRHADQKISSIAFDAGFGDLSYFNRVFRRHFGAAPSEFRAAAHDDAI